MKKRLVRYMVFCCLLSADMVLLYHTGEHLPRVLAEESQTDYQKEYEIPEVQAGMQVYLTQENLLEQIMDQETEPEQGTKQPQARNAFCRQVETIRSEPVAAVEQADTSEIQLSAADYDCLLKIVESEAGVCDRKGKILVANVVLNRMNSRYFPDTVREVVYQKNQFSPVENGSIDQVSVTEDTRQAVSMALSGTDYSQGALFFAARELAEEDNMDWFDRSLNYLFEHDGHEFFALKQTSD